MTMKSLDEMNEAEKQRPTSEINNMKVGELVHHMLINFNPHAWGKEFYAQNTDYIEAFNRLQELEIKEG